ncbi:tyrosine-type recombinase/integrase [Nioella sp.]|uniref:tyrosine-type recombinase/integrase n=1 Tax=Nioella sp. TaxID=1912091 RepID=UPI003A864D5C
MNGIRRSKTFDHHSSAKNWAAYTEAELRQERDDARTGVIRFTGLLDEYEKRVSRLKKGHGWEVKQFAVLRRTLLADKLAHEITKAHISRWKDDRLSEVTGSTVNRQMNLLSHIFTMAIEWGYADVNPVSKVSRPKENEPRQRLPTVGELDATRLAARWDGVSAPVTVKQRVYVAFLFSCETAMRQGEIAGISPDDLDGRVVRLPKTKNGSARHVPLTPRAQELLGLVESDFSAWHWAASPAQSLRSPSAGSPLEGAGHARDASCRA